jgi:serine/threonine-protein kinase
VGTQVAERLGAALRESYRIERELGRGGMATVYLAHDLRHDRAVALKVLHPELSAWLGPERFAHEIRTTAKLRHPHILPLFDSGNAHGLLFFVMPFVQGESLRARLERERQLPVEEALRIAQEIGDGLSYAHAQGVIHRDIKPENVLLEGGHALIADFGIARVRDSNTRITQAGYQVGTPAYMSPEQAAGEPDLDGRSDLYALASVVYEMLSGETPFTGATAEAILVQRFSQTPPRLGLKRPGVPRAVEAAIAGALQRAPEDRFPTVERFLAALRAKEPAPSGTASIAVLPFANMSGDPENEYFSDGISEEIINALTQLPGLRVAARTSAFSFKGKQQDLRAIGEQLGVGTVLEGSVRRAGGRLRITAQLINVADGYHLWSERYDRELTDVFAIQDEIAAAIAARLELTLRVDAAGGRLVKPPTANVEAYDHFLRGHALMNSRGPALVGGVVAFEQAIALDPRFAAALAELAETLTLSALYGLSHPAKVRARAGEAAAQALAGDPGHARAHLAVGLVALMLEFDREKAARALDRAAELEPQNPDVRSTRGIVAMSYIRGDPDSAEAEIRIALANDPLSALAHSQLAMSLTWAGRYQGAEAEAETAIRLDPNAFYPRWTLIFPLALGGGPERALAMAPELLARFGRHPWVLMASGLANLALGRRDIASALADELEARSRSEFVGPGVLATLAMSAGRKADLWRHLRQATEIRDPLWAVAAPHSSLFAPVRQEPEFQALLRQLGWDKPIAV